MRVVALGDRDPGFLTHREIDATIDGYTASAGLQSRQPQKFTARLSARRAQAVSAFLLGGHRPAGMKLTVKALGPARDGAGGKQDRRSTIAYQRFVVTTDR